jgi:hypothetical protein
VDDVQQANEPPGAQRAMELPRVSRVRRMVVILANARNAEKGDFVLGVRDHKRLDLIQANGTRGEANDRDLLRTDRAVERGR